MRRLLHVGASALIILANITAAAVAQDYPNLVGVWKGKADAVVLGDADHFENRGDSGQYRKEPRVAGFDITIAIKRQAGRYIWGTISGGETTEPWLGSIWNDGKGYRAVDGNGHVSGRIISANELENCYTHTGKSIVASCAILTRQ